MITIPNKVVQYKDEFGDLIDQNIPAKELPSGVRTHFDGTNWMVAEDSKDEDILVNSCPSLKEIVDEQKIVAEEAKNPPKDPGPVDPVDPVDPVITP